MPVILKTLPAYRDSRNGLVEAMGAAERVLAVSPFSADPASPYQSANRALAAGAIQLRILAFNALRAIDEEIAAGDLVADLNAQAKAAHDEADDIAETAEQIEKAAAVIDRISGIVTGIAGLVA
jgi:hypothetical protein